MENFDLIKQAIADGDVFLGIELGSTRIKSVLIGQDHKPIADGSYEWQNQLKDGIWTYSLEAAWVGVQASFADLAHKVEDKYALPIKKIQAIGISAMMHGYLVFDLSGAQLVPFRTWRNTITEQAASELTSLFEFNVPQRWSIAHLYQAILNGEEHVQDIAFMTTLSGYVHWKLTGNKVLGVGEASGMFPIDSAHCDYDKKMMEQFQQLVADKGCGWDIESILPKVLGAGEVAGQLTQEGARLLDPKGNLEAGAILCPPEGDAGTGMVATNSIKERTGNVSAGTSIFAMVVLERQLSKVHIEIDMVTTPAGKPVAMVHCNNCTSDIDAWIKMFDQLLRTLGVEVDKSMLYKAVYFKALEAEEDAGGVLSYNYYSGEPITKLDEGRPLMVRNPDSDLSLANFARSMLFSAMATLKIGMDILTDQEGVQVQQMLGHGGLFKTERVAQQLMASALKVPVVVMDSASEGGAWGIALLAAYTAQRQPEETLESYLEQKVFAGDSGSRIEPNEADMRGFERYMARYKQGLPVQRAAVDNLNI